MLPQSSEAEQGLLCSFLLHPDGAALICAEKGITPAHFHIPTHATIFALLLEFHDANRPCDFIVLTQTLRDRGSLEEVGGAAFISGLFCLLPTAANAAYYADILAEKHTLREMIRVCTVHGARCYEEQDQPAALLDAFEAEVSAIRKGDEMELREVCPKSGANAAVAAIEDFYHRKGAISGISTGFADLDKMTDGLHAGEMLVIAARPSMGKTALAMNMAEHIAVTQKKPVAVFSCEMSSGQLHQRLVCSRARMNLHRLREGFEPERSFAEMKKAASEIAESKLFVIDAVGASITAVRAKARRMHRKHRLAAIFVDYLQLLRSKTAQAARSREREIAEISEGLKNLSKELSIPVVVLAQLNRNAESRAGADKGRPMLSDLRESGSIEQDADFVGLLVREEYYAASEEQRQAAEGKATLIIAKQRNGPVGDVPLTFLKEFARFESRA